MLDFQALVFVYFLHARAGELIFLGQRDPALLDHLVDELFCFLYLLILLLHLIVDYHVLLFLNIVGRAFDHIAAHLPFVCSLLVRLQLQLVESLHALLNFFVFHAHLPLQIKFTFLSLQLHHIFLLLP